MLESKISNKPLDPVRTAYTLSRSHWRQAVKNPDKLEGGTINFNSIDVKTSNAFRIVLNQFRRQSRKDVVTFVTTYQKNVSDRLSEALIKKNVQKFLRVSEFFLRKIDELEHLKKV